MNDRMGTDENGQGPDPVAVALLLLLASFGLALASAFLCWGVTIANRKPDAPAPLRLRLAPRSAQSSLTTFDEKECCHSKAKEPKKPDQRPVLKATGQPEVVVTKCSQ